MFAESNTLGSAQVQRGGQELGPRAVSAHAPQVSLLQPTGGETITDRLPKWSKHWTNSPLRALLAMAVSKTAYKISSACWNAFWEREFRRN
jgi:hypothetical protein